MRKLNSGVWTNSPLGLLIPKKWRIRNPIGGGITNPIPRDWDWIANLTKLKYVIKHDLNPIHHLKLESPIYQILAYSAKSYSIIQNSF